MAVTVTNVTNPGGLLSEGQLGQLKFRIVDILFDASYLTTGEPLTAASFGWIYFFGGIVVNHAKNAAGTLAMPLTIVANSTGSSIALQLLRYDGAAAGKASLEEAANAFDASLFTARVLLLGY